MNCEKCGAPVDGKAFCSQCGAPVAQAGGQPPQPLQQPGQTLGNPTKVLVFGILSLALSGGFVGIIFGIIGLVQAKQYNQTYGPVSKQVNIGRGLSIAGIIVSIVCLIICIACIIFVAANWDTIVEAAKQADGYSYSYNINF